MVDRKRPCQIAQDASKIKNRQIYRLRKKRRVLGVFVYFKKFYFFKKNIVLRN